MRLNQTVAAAVLCIASSAFARDDARSAIEAANKKWMAAFSKGDMKAVVKLYAEDAVVMPPNAAAAKGRAAIQAAFESSGPGTASVQLTTVDVEAHGDIAIETGTYTVSVRPPGQPPIDKADEGNYIVVWKKVSGQWLFYRDIWNSSRPAPAASPATAAK